MKTLICHSFPAWDTPYVKSTLELLTRMASTHRVIFLDYAYTWKDLIRNPHVPVSNILGKKRRIEKVPFGEVEIFHAFPMIPCNWVKNQALFSLLMVLNAWIMGFTIRRIMGKVDPSQAILINAFNPVFGVFTRSYWKGLRTIYYCYDEIGATQWAGKWGKQYEPVFAQMADQIITTSKPLAAKFSDKKTHVVKNGVNLNLFSKGIAEKVKTQRMGYIGAIDDRIDQGILVEIARKFPDYSIELIGPVKTAWRVELPSNIQFSGALPQTQLPELIREWEVCLIPFVRSPLTRAIYPLKINEYLMAGKPVVCTSFTDLSDFGNLISIATDTHEFIQGIQKEIRYNNRLKIQKRMDFARENSWENRTELFLQVIAS